MTQHGLDRRDVLRAGAGLVTLALATPARAELSPAVREAIRDLVGEAVPVDGGITLQAPALAENGAFVPVTVAVDSPMTAADHVRAIHLIATKNPTPGIASYRLGPANGRAVVSTRIRLAEHQTIIALAETSDGTVRRAVASVRVTVGGCLT